MPVRHLIATLLCAGLTLLVGPSALAASPQPASEYAVKAAILYKITKFVSWPEGSFTAGDSALSICLTDDSPFSEAMQSLNGRSVRGHAIKILQFDPAGDLPDCHVLFIGRDERERMLTLLSSIGDRPVLTVGEDEVFAQQGGIISLEVQRSRVQFAINIAASQHAGLGISAQLLQLAQIVEQEGS